jgi:hypothetical protein
MKVHMNNGLKEWLQGGSMDPQDERLAIDLGAWLPNQSQRETGHRV